MWSYVPNKTCPSKSSFEDFVWFGDASMRDRKKERDRERESAMPAKAKDILMS